MAERYEQNVHTERHESARRDRCRLIVLPGSVFACLHGWPAGKLITICGQGISGQGVCGRKSRTGKIPGPERRLAIPA